MKWPLAFAAIVLALSPALAEDAADPGVIEGDVPFITPDTTAFAAQCRADEGLLNWMSSGAMSAEDARDAVCGCLADEFKLSFSQSTVDILARTLNGTITDAERASHRNYESFARQAEAIMGACVTKLGL